MQNFDFDNAIDKIKTQTESNQGLLQLGLVAGATILVISLFKIRVWKPVKKYRSYRRKRRSYRKRK